MMIWGITWFCIGMFFGAFVGVMTMTVVIGGTKGDTE